MGKRPSKKTKKKTNTKKGSPGRVLGFLFIFLITFIVLIFVLKLPPYHKKNKIHHELGSYKQHLKFEEKLATPFEEKIKTADLAILQAVIKSGLSQNRLSHVDLKKEMINQKSFFFQYLQLTGQKEKITIFKNYLKKYIYNWIKNSELQLDPTKITILINNIPTHIIFLTQEIPLKAKSQKKGHIVLIIDDIGRDLYKAQELIDLFGPKINLSILPYTPHAKEIDNLCKKLNIPTMLHMPMEPLSYPETNPGPGALLTTMDNNELKNTTLRALNTIKYIVAVNNHMGSKFTEDIRGMTIFLTQLKQHHLVFIDSCTTPKSVATKIGKKLGMKIYKRDIFIDNKKDIDAILYELKKAEIYSLKKGYVIAIGHPYKETIEALTLWKHIKSANVSLTPVVRLIYN